MSRKDAKPPNISTLNLHATLRNPSTILILAACTAHALDVSPREILENPDRFDGRPVTVSGMILNLRETISQKGNPYYTFNLSDNERQAIGADRLPTSLKEAIANLKRDRVLLQSMGERLSTSYIAVKELDIDAFARADEAFEFRQHIYKF